VVILNLSGHFEFGFSLVLFAVVYIHQIYYLAWDYTYNAVKVISCGPSYVPVKGELPEIVTCQSGPGRGQHIILTEPVDHIATLAAKLNIRRLRPVFVQTVPDLKHSNQ